MMKKINKDEEGSALVLAMMVLLVLSVLGATLGTLTVGSYRLSDNSRDYNSAYYIAEAGANMAYEEVKKGVNKTYVDSTISGEFFNSVNKLPIIKDEREYHDFALQSGSQPTATVTVTEESSKERDSKEYIIKSVGKVAGKERMVEKPFTVTWQDKEIENSNENSLGLPKDAAIIFNELVDFGQNNDVKVSGRVIGDVGAETNGKGNQVPDLESLELDWSSYLEALNNIPNVAKELPPQDLVFETNGETLNYKVSSLDFKTSSITVEGGGTVNIFLEKPFANSDFNSDSKITEKVNGQLNIIYSGTDPFSIGNGATGEFVLFAPKSSINFDNGATLTGSIIVRNATFKKDSKIIFPEGLVYDFPFDPSTDESGPEELINNKELIETTPAIEQ